MGLKPDAAESSFVPEPATKTVLLDLMLELKGDVTVVSQISKKS